MEAQPNPNEESQHTRSTSRAAMQRLLLRDSVSLVEDGSEQPNGVRKKKPEDGSVMRFEWDKDGNLLTTLLTEQ